ncbi:peptidoglycan-binding protein [Streptomyces oryzae]|uniref:Peptidoglycan-binding protein n=1 Tax=Streptomyces oryzae TaxID=1434886 RepID=A0ABS3XAB9_9ACTN|nr:HlyD family efflux transporter periplasmic adaptor subunit [Streptomyces oryzae]MBO8192007.1 peptidoglycan-binding protein [Streptomyces oryzae]
MSATQLPREDEAVSPPDRQSEPPPVRRKPRGPAVLVVVAILAAVGAGVVVADPFGKSAKDSSARTAAPTGLAKVTQGTLSARTLQNGTLGYAGSYDVVNNTKGTITKVPAAGDVISQGDVLYRVDGKPVVLLQGATEPVYRDLSYGTEGPDVRQLNAALVSLGYATKDEIDPDSDYFSWLTVGALKELQEDVGLDESGELPLGQAVFLPTEEVRISKADAVRGGPARQGQNVLQVSSTKRQVVVELNASEQSGVAVDDKVTITLPNGKTAPGMVSSVGKVAKQAEDKSTIEVHIKPKNPKVTGGLDQAPVQVAIISDTVEDVLSVPVNALLARSGGGYAVEVVDPGGKHELVPVRIGLFDDSEGKVEVSGARIAVGQKIVVPAS